MLSPKEDFSDQIASQTIPYDLPIEDKYNLVMHKMRQAKGALITDLSDVLNHITSSHVTDRIYGYRLLANVIDKTNALMEPMEYQLHIDCDNLKTPSPTLPQTPIHGRTR